MSTNLLENTTSELEVEKSTIPRLGKTSKPRTFGEYIQASLDAVGLSPYRAEKKSKEEAEKRGLDKAFTISDAMIGNIINDAQDNLQMSKLKALAWTLELPLEEVVGVAFGFYERLSEFQRSEAFKLWSAQQELTGDSVEYYAQRISDLTHEMMAGPKRLRR